MKTTIISTGEELVRGRSQDTNAPFLAMELEHVGFEIRRMVIVADDPAALRDEVARACADSELVVMTGGLGPTADDRTRGAIAEAAGVGLAEDAESREHVADRIRSFGHEPSPEHLSQALFPEGSVIFPNERGTARGFGIRIGDARLVSMPGVPSEMKPMFLASVLPFVVQELAPSERVRVETVNIFPASESEVDERVADMSAHGRNPSLGITVRDGVVSVSVRARSEDEAEAERLLARDLAVLDERFGDRVYGRNRDTLATAVSRLLEKTGATIGVAESLTGGLVTDRLVDVPGISRFLLAGIVAYSNDVKVARLGVPAELIERHGAVSAEVAEAMAAGVCQAVGCDLGISTTGIAGPTGGTAAKPVGLLYVAARLGGTSRAETLRMRGERRPVKDRAAKHALNLARLTLLAHLRERSAEGTIRGD